MFYINNLIENKLNISRVSNNSCLQHQMIKPKINYSGEEQNILLDFTLKISNSPLFHHLNQKTNIPE